MCAVTWSGLRGGGTEFIFWLHMKPLGFKFEKKFLSKDYSHIVGCDEVGRGALAGPIVAAAVVWGEDAEFRITNQELSKVQDSKLLKALEREKLVFHIKHHAVAWSIAQVSPQVIDRINIHQANLLALYRAVEGVHKKLEHYRSDKTYTLIDGRFTIPQLHSAQQAVVDGDAKVFSIAAASILAKVYRDEYMMKQDQKFPGYYFSAHKGYGTELHRKAIAALGPSPIHRQTFCTRILIPVKK